MILSGQTIRQHYGGMIQPFFERTVAGPFKRMPAMTWGLGPAGYDVRLEFDEEGKIESKTLWPNDFMLASTIERFRMPGDVLGMVCDKSTWARKGVAVQHTVIEPGWEGWLTLELTNHSSNPIHLERGMPIAQIVFHMVDHTVERSYSGKYQNQGRGPKDAK